MSWENYKRRFAKHKEEMREIVAAVANSFESDITEDNGDDYGFSFAVERPDGRILTVALAITDREESDLADQSGTLVVRMEDGETSSSWGPDNYSEHCWADYHDDDAWRIKLDAISEHFITVPGQIDEWKSKAAPAINR